MQKQGCTKKRIELRPIGFWDFENPFKAATQSIVETTAPEALRQDMEKVGQDFYRAIDKYEQKKQGSANRSQ